MERVTLERVIDAWDEQALGYSEEEAADLWGSILGQEGKLLSELMVRDEIDMPCGAYEFLLLHFVPQSVLLGCAVASIKRVFKHLRSSVVVMPTDAIKFMVDFCEWDIHTVEDASEAMLEMDKFARKIRHSSGYTKSQVSQVWGMNSITNAAFLICVAESRAERISKSLYPSVMRACVRATDTCESDLQRAEIILRVRAEEFEMLP